MAIAAALSEGVIGPYTDWYEGAVAQFTKPTARAILAAKPTNRES
jgi:hypothetical protein